MREMSHHEEDLTGRLGYVRLGLGANGSMLLTWTLKKLKGKDWTELAQDRN